MCSICGGTKWDKTSRYIWQESVNRGRDDHGKLELPIPYNSWIGNHRAIPTTEVEFPKEKQPVGTNPKIVFNGILSNDNNLGLKTGEADTSVLPRVLDFSDLLHFKQSIESKLVGSYAIGVLFENGDVWLAANYKPIWIGEKDGQMYFSSLQNHFPPEIRPYRMPPYSVLNLLSGENYKIERTLHDKAGVICSAGLDSTAVAAYAVATHGKENVTLIHYNYGCRAENKERESIIKIADYFGCGLEFISLPSFGGSSLLDTTSNIAEGEKGAEYAHEWVPARNLLMLSAAVAYSEAKQIGHIYLGTNLEEAGAYPDNEEQFILDFDSILWGAVQNGIEIKIHTPLGGLMKHEVVRFGNAYKAPFSLTWSCYLNGQTHCGKCGPCFMRKTAFERNGLADPVMPRGI